MRINVHGGHNKYSTGASSVLNELTEDRKVKDLVISKLRALGHTVYDCTDDAGKTQKQNLKNIVSKCNAHSVDIDVSIHFNSGAKNSNGDGKTTGTEVYYYSLKGKAYAEKVVNAIAELGFKNRNAKSSSTLYVLKHTNSPAILIECCFVDDKDDANLYNAEKMANAIVKGIAGVDLSIKVAYAGHVQDIGWTSAVADGATCGTVGQSKRLEAIQIDTRLSGLDIYAKAHIANEGWHDYGKVNNDTVIGTVGKAEALECLCLNCTNANVVYRVHQANVGWSSWTKADGISTLGSVGQSLQLEAVQIKVI